MSSKAEKSIVPWEHSKRRGPKLLLATNPKPPKEPNVKGVIGYDLTVAGQIYMAFTNGYNIAQACQFAGISRQTYYNWVEAFPDFAEGVEVAKNMLGRKAKETITASIQAGDVGTARWYLERRDPDFKPKAEVDNKQGLQQTRDKIKEFLDDRDDLTNAEAEDAGGAEPTEPTATVDRENLAQAPSDIS